MHPHRDAPPPLPSRVDVTCPKCGARAVFLRGEDADADAGVCQCDHCVSRFVHRLRWPADAYWRTDVRGFTLWAHNRAELRIIADFIASADRDPDRYPGRGPMLRRLPRGVLSAKLREEAVRRLGRLLDA